MMSADSGTSGLLPAPLAFSLGALSVGQRV
jgi:hypothetical protein